MAKIHRFIGNFELKQNELEIGGETAHQIMKVLKLEVGEKIELCDGKGLNALVQIKSFGKNSVNIEVEMVGEDEEEKRKITLFCAVLKKENFELVVQKATECGVSKIVPIITSRTVKTGLNIERLQKIAKEASEQSGRSFVPEISEPVDFIKSLAEAKGENIIFHQDNTSPLSPLHSKNGEGWLQSRRGEVGIFIGPEGGWTPEEIVKAKSSHFQIASLGKNTLRAETAAIIATYLVSNLK